MEDTNGHPSHYYPMRHHSMTHHFRHPTIRKINSFCRRSDRGIPDRLLPLRRTVVTLLNIDDERFLMITRLANERQAYNSRERRVPWRSYLVLRISLLKRLFRVIRYKHYSRIRRPRVLDVRTYIMYQESKTGRMTFFPEKITAEMMRCAKLIEKIRL